MNIHSVSANTFNGLVARHRSSVEGLDTAPCAQCLFKKSCDKERALDLFDIRDEYCTNNGIKETVTIYPFKDEVIKKRPDVFCPDELMGGKLSEGFVEDNTLLTTKIGKRLPFTHKELLDYNGTRRKNLSLQKIRSIRDTIEKLGEKEFGTYDYSNALMCFEVEKPKQVKK